jgi:hypothetical protein
MDPHPLNANDGPRKRGLPDQRRSSRLMNSLNTPLEGASAPGTDSAWALRLKDAVDTAIRELDVEVVSAKAVLAESQSQESVFELETNRGRLRAIRLPDGAFQFHWLN